MSNNNTVPVDSLVVEVEPKQDGTPWISTTPDTEPYLYRALPSNVGNAELDTLVGGTINWNQLASLSSSDWTLARITFTASGTEIKINPSLTSSNTKYIAIPATKGHKYLMSGTFVNSKSNYGFSYGVYFTSSSNYDERITISWSSGGNDVPFSHIFNVQNDGRQLRVQMGTTSETTNYITIDKLQIFDLTAMLGSSIADYIYTLESGTAGAGVAWLKKYGFLTKDYYAYDAGSLLSVKTSAKVITGKNILGDEAFANSIKAALSSSTLDTTAKTIKFNGTTNGTSDIRLESLPFKENTQYTLIYSYTGNNKNLRWKYTDGTYDSSSNVTDGAYVSAQGKTVKGLYKVNNTNTYVVLSYESCGIFEGVLTASDFEAYNPTTYALDSDLELRGIPKLDANNNLVYNGDVYPPSGNVGRKYWIVDLGTLTWQNAGGMKLFYTTGLQSSIRKAASNTEQFTWGIDSKGLAHTTYNGITQSTPYSICVSTGGNILATLDVSSAYTDGTAFGTAMSGAYLVYELATETTESADPYTSPQSVSEGGTEEYVDSRTVPMPVGHKTTYYEKAPITGTDTVDVEVTGPNLLGGTMLADAVVSSMPSATIDYDEKYVLFASNASTNHSISSGYIKFKENTRYTFIITLYKSSGTGSNLVIYYTDGSLTYVPGPSAAGSKETVKLTSDPNKTISSLQKRNSSGSTRIYYDESGIFEGVLDFDGFVPYSGQMLTADIATNLYSPTVGQLASGTINSSGVNGTNSTRCRTNGYIPVSELTQYTFTYVGDFDNYIFFYDNTKTFIEDSALEWAAQPRTFTTPETAAYVRFVWKIAYASGPSDIQLELGPSATPYRWHSSGYESTYDFISGDLFVKRNYVDLADFTSWSRRTTNIFSVTLGNSTLYDATIPITEHLCDTFETTYVNAVSNAVNAKLSLFRATNSTAENTIYLNMAFAGIDTVDELNEWLSIVHPCFCYKFYSPREYDLLEDPLSIYAPSDTKIVVSSTSGDVISATFSYDRQNYILHSITFYDGYRKLNTYTNFHLIADPRPSVTPPSPKSKYLDVPGANGKLDLSTILTGFPVFDNREGDWTFYVLNGYGNWADRLSEIMNFLQGQQLKMVLEDDPNYYYRGRFYVSDWSSEPTWSKITIHYSVYPYKIGCTETAGPNNTIYLTDTGGTSL